MTIMVDRSVLRIALALALGCGLVSCDQEALALGPPAVSGGDEVAVWMTPSGQLEIPGVYRVRQLMLGGKDPVESFEHEDGVLTSTLTFEADVVHPISYWVDTAQLRDLTTGLDKVSPDEQSLLCLAGVPSLRLSIQESGESELVYDGVPAGSLGHVAGAHHRGEHSELHAVAAHESLGHLEIDVAPTPGGLLIEFTEFMDQDVAQLMTISVIGDGEGRLPYLFLREDGSGFVAACAPGEEVRS